MKGQQRVNITSGKALTFELLLPAGSNSQWVLPFQHNLQRLGITMNIRRVDNSQITNRLRSRDYDMMPRLYRAMPWPSSDLQILWASEYIDSSYNAPGVQSPVIDKLISQIIAAQGNKAKLIPLGRALDRVLTRIITCCRCGLWPKIGWHGGTNFRSLPFARFTPSAWTTGGMTSTKRPNFPLPDDRENKWAHI